MGRRWYSRAAAGFPSATPRSTQRAYDPSSRPDRAESQELGDCVAEGLFSLLDQGGEIRDADRAFWRSFLSSRRVLIDEISARVPAQGSVTVAGGPGWSRHWRPPETG